MVQAAPFIALGSQQNKLMYFRGTQLQEKQKKNSENGKRGR